MWCVMGMGENVVCDRTGENVLCDVMGMGENVVCDGDGRKCGV